MSIHKSQGQTIHRVKVNLGRIFEKGKDTHFAGTYPMFGLMEMLRTNIRGPFTGIFDRRAPSHWVYTGKGERKGR